MQELFTVWRNTRMIVLTAICAAVYVAVLIPFKILPIIPGFTEVRPAAVIPVACSLLFGPAAAWGSGLGNIIGDFLGGMFGPGSLFGFAGNFLLGFVPYKLLSGTWSYDPLSRQPANLARFGLVVLVACAACSTMIGWGIDLLGFVPFAALANISFANNLILNLILGPLVLGLVYRRVRLMGLWYGDIPGLAAVVRSPGRAMIGKTLLVIGAVGGLMAGNLVSLLQAGPALPMPLILTPFIACMLAAVVLM